jgi:DNA polymerase-3 subunit epsilon
LLAQVYVELLGGRQIGLGLVSEAAPVVAVEVIAAPVRARPPRVFSPSEAELVAHAAFLKGVKEPLWGVAAFD